MSGEREREREGEREKDKENYQLINSGWRMGNGGRGTAVHGRPKIDKEGGNNHISDGGREQGNETDFYSISVIGYSNLQSS